MYSKEELSVLMDYLEEKPFHWQVLILLALSTGAREGEIAALEWKHINFKKGTVYIEQSITEVVGKGVQVKSTKTERCRLVSLPDPLFLMLKQLYVQREQEKEDVGDAWEWGDHFFLFGNEFGKPIRPDSISQWWRRFTKKYKIKHI